MRTTLADRHEGVGVIIATVGAGLFLMGDWLLCMPVFQPRRAEQGGVVAGLVLFAMGVVLLIAGTNW